MTEKSTPEQEAPKNLPDLIAAAMANPGENLPIVVGLGLAALLLAAAIYKMLKPQKQLKVTLSDVSTNADDQVEERKEKAAPKSKAKLKSKYATLEYREAIDEDALTRELDQEGPFRTKLQGTIEPESLVKLRRLINKHGYAAFGPRKQALLEERIGYLKAKKVQEYAQCIARAS